MINHMVDKKPLPVLFEQRENCCGCSACFAICPAHSIEMKPDTEGFLYPTIIESTCVRCYKCLSVCAFKVDQANKGFYDLKKVDKR